MTSFGETLRREREERKIPLDQVARETRIQQRFLAALEGQELDELPGSVFNRGYLRTYALYLGLDPEPLLLEYVEEEGTQTRDGRIQPEPDPIDALRESVKRGGGRSRGLRNAAARTLLRVVLPAVVVLGGLGAVLWINLPGPGGPEPAATQRGAVRTETAAQGLEASLAVGGPGETEPRSPGRTAGAPATGVEREDPAAGAEPQEAPSGAGDPAVVKNETADSAASPAPAGVPAERSEAGDSAGTASRLQIADFGVGTGVANRQLVGRGDRFEEGEAIVFWTRVTGGWPGDTIRHVWLREGEAASSVELSIGGSHWRTYSRRTLRPGSAGRWTVEARDAGNRVLARATFVCGEAGDADP